MTAGVIDTEVDGLGKMRHRFVEDRSCRIATLREEFQ